MQLLRTNNFRQGLLVPSLNLDFTTGVFPSQLSFSRASAGTYFDSSGVLQSAGVNVPRLDYDPVTLAARGLLIEEQRTNLIVNSDGNSSTNWGNYGGVPFPALSGTGGVQNGYFAIRRVNASGFEGVRRNVTGLVVGTVYAVSVYARKNPSANATNVVISTPSGITATPIANSVDLTTAWKRFTLTFTATATSGDFNFYNSSSAIGEGFDICCFQLEAGAFPTSYIPTTSAAVTRSADVCSMNVGSWYNVNQGSWYSEFNLLNTVGGITKAVFEVSAGNALNRYQLAVTTASNARWNQSVNNVNTGEVSASPVASNTVTKVLTTYTSSQNLICLNGGVVNSVATSLPGQSLTILAIGSGGGGPINNFLNGHIRKVANYRNRLPNSLLQSLTA